MCVRTRDVDLVKGTISIDAEDTKTDVQIVEKPLTKEVVNQLRIWDEYRRRERRNVDEHGNVVKMTKTFGPNEKKVVSFNHVGDAFLLSLRGIEIGGENTI